MACQAQNQALLAADPFQMVQLFVLGALIELQRDLQTGVLHFQIRADHQFAGLDLLIDDHQIAAQQVPIVLLVSLTNLHQTQRAARRVQGVANQVMGAARQLQLHGVVQLIARFGFHKAGIRRADQRAEFHGGHAELLFAVRIQIEHGPAGFIQPLETQHAEPRRHR